MNGGRVAKRLLAVVLFLSTVITLGLYYNGSSGVGGGVGGGAGGRMDDRLPAHRGAPAIADDDEWPPRPTAAVGYLTNDVVPAEPKKRPAGPPGPSRPPHMSATVDRDTCPELGLANTTIDTVAQFSRFEFQVRFFKFFKFFTPLDFSFF